MIHTIDRSDFRAKQKSYIIQWRLPIMRKGNTERNSGHRCLANLALALLRVNLLYSPHPICPPNVYFGYIYNPKHKNTFRFKDTCAWMKAVATFSACLWLLQVFNCKSYIWQQYWTTLSVIKPSFWSEIGKHTKSYFIRIPIQRDLKEN